MIKGLKVALQLYSVRDEAAKDLKRILHEVKAMGYDGVEFAGLYDYNPAAVREIVSDLGLEPVSAHVPLTELLDDTAHVINKYKQIGCPYIAVPWLDESRRPGHENWDKCKSDIAYIALECEKQGIVLLYHNHDFEFAKDKLTGEYALDQLYREIPALFTEIDTCWVKVAGEDPQSYVRKYRGRAPIVHLKDFAMTGEKPERMYELIGVKSDDDKNSSSFEFRPVGFGVQNIPGIIDAAIYSGAQWVVVEQDSPGMGKSPLECAKMSIEYLIGLA